MKLLDGGLKRWHHQHSFVCCVDGKRRFFWGTFLGYSSYACQNGNRTEVISYPGSLIFDRRPGFSIFFLPSSLTNPSLGILLTPCHTNIPHSAYAELHKQSSAKSPLKTHVCAGTWLHTPAYARTQMHAHTHTQTHTGWLVRHALWSCLLIRRPMAW